MADRLNLLFDGIARLIETWAPDAAAVEEIFVNRNPGSTLRLGQARGVVMLAPARRRELRSTNMRPMQSRNPSSASAMPIRPRFRRW